MGLVYMPAVFTCPFFSLDQDILEACTFAHPQNESKEAAFQE